MRNIQTDEKEETTVLIADDHPLIRVGLRLSLEEAAGIRVVGEAIDGYSPESVTRSLQSPCFPIIINELSTNNHAPSRCKRLKWLTQSSSLSRSCPTT